MNLEASLPIFPTVILYFSRWNIVMDLLGFDHVRRQLVSLLHSAKDRPYCRVQVEPKIAGENRLFIVVFIMS